MRIKIIAPYKGATSTGMFGADGKEIPIGTEITVDEKNFDLPPNRYEIIDGSGEGKTPVLNAESGQPASTTTGAYALKDNGNGWFVITKDGEEVTKSVRKGDVEGFDSMSDADKQALADLYKKD